MTTRPSAVREVFVRHHGRMPVAEPPRFIARDEIAAGDVAEHRQLAVVQRHVDVLAEAIAVGGDQRGEARLRRCHAGEQIGDRYPRAHRRAVGLTGDRHQPALCLNDVIVTKPRGGGTGAAIARDRAIDQARIDLGDAGIIEPEPVEPAELVILDQDVRFGGKVENDRLPLRARQIDRDRAFAAIGAEIIGALPARERRTPGAGVVAAFRVLDLDHFGAQIGEDLPAPWPRPARATDRVARRAGRGPPVKGAGRIC